MDGREGDARAIVESVEVRGVLDRDMPVPEVEREVQRVQATGETIVELIGALEERLSTVLSADVREDGIKTAARIHVECGTELGRRLAGTGDMLDRQVERLLEVLNRIAL